MLRAGATERQTEFRPAAPCWRLRLAGLGFILLASETRAAQLGPDECRALMAGKSRAAIEQFLKEYPADGQACLATATSSSRGATAHGAGGAGPGAGHGAGGNGGTAGHGGSGGAGGNGSKGSPKKAGAGFGPEILPE